MIRAIPNVIFVLAGLWCLLALADRWGWTEPLWEKGWPQTILPRRPSPVEVQAADIEARTAVLRTQIAETKKVMAASAGKRQGLIARLMQQLHDNGSAGDAACLETDNPVAFALVRAIDADDQRQAETRRMLSEMDRQLARLEARRIAVDNGLSLIDPVASSGPGEHLRAETGEESTATRYERIVREATNAN